MGAADKIEVANINNVIMQLSNSIRWVSAYAPFIYCKIGNLTFATSNIDSKSNYLLSLTHEKTGIGKANTFTLNIAYVPNPRDPNVLDETNELESLDVELIGSKIEFSYGYNFPNWVTHDVETDASDVSVLDGLQSAKYTGIIYDYSIEITNSYINYRITGVSSLGVLKDYILNLTAEEMLEKAGGTYDPINLVKGLLEMAIKDMGLDYKVIDNVHNNCGCVLNKDLFTDVKEQPLFDFINSTILPSVRSANPDQSSIQIESETDAESEEGSKENSTEKEQTPPVDLITFSFTAHDQSTNPCITIDYDDPNESFATNRVVDFAFNWMSGRLTDIVLNFTPDFKGSVAIANAASLKNTIKQLAEGPNKTRSVAITGDGVMEVLKSYVEAKVPANSGDGSVLNIMTAIAEMAIFQQTPYSASLSTLGIPYDIPILTHINVRPMIYGKLHYTAGEYKILKQTDSISSGGFTSEFEIFRIASGDMTERITEIISGATSAES